MKEKKDWIKQLRMVEPLGQHTTYKEGGMKGSRENEDGKLNLPMEKFGDGGNK